MKSPYKPEAYSELSQTSKMEFFPKKKGFFTKKLHVRCSTKFWIRLCRTSELGFRKLTNFQNYKLQSIGPCRKKGSILEVSHRSFCAVSKRSRFYFSAFSRFRINLENYGLPRKSPYFFKILEIWNKQLLFRTCYKLRKTR